MEKREQLVHAETKIKVCLSVCLSVSVCVCVLHVQHMVCGVRTCTSSLAHFARFSYLCVCVGA